MNIFSSIFDIVVSILGSLISIIEFLLVSFKNGIQFFTSTFTSIPNLLFDLFDLLPSYFQVGISGIFGLLLLVVFFKLLILFKII